MNQSLSKETIEALICDRYVGATGFEWDNTSIKFDFDSKKDVIPSYEYESIINRLQLRIIELTARLKQTERCMRIAVDELSVDWSNDE